MSNLTKQQFQSAVQSILDKNQVMAPEMAEVAAANRATAAAFRAFDPELAAIVGAIAQNQEAVGRGFAQLVEYAKDKLEK